MVVGVIGAVVLSAAIVLVDRSHRHSLRRIDAVVVDPTSVPVSRAPMGDAEVLETLSRSLRAGDSVVGAIERVADPAGGGLAAELSPIAVAVQAGRPLGPELRHRIGIAAETERAPLRLLHVALSQGGSTASALADAAAAVREEDELRSDAVVQSTQAMASAAVVAALPVGFLGLSTLTAPMIPAFLFGEPLGWAILSIGLTLDGVGFWWMRRMVDGVLR